MARQLKKKDPAYTAALWIGPAVALILWFVTGQMGLGVGVGIVVEVFAALIWRSARGL